MSERSRYVAKKLFGIEFPPFERATSTEHDKYIEALVEGIIEANQSVYDQLNEDMRFHGACYLKSYPDGTFERVDPTRVFAPMVEV